MNEIVIVQSSFIHPGICLKMYTVAIQKQWIWNYELNTQTESNCVSYEDL